MTEIKTYILTKGLIVEELLSRIGYENNFLISDLDDTLWYNFMNMELFSKYMNIYEVFNMDFIKQNFDLDYNGRSLIKKIDCLSATFGSNFKICTRGKVSGIAEREEITKTILTEKHKENVIYADQNKMEKSKLSFVIDNIGIDNINKFDDIYFIDDDIDEHIKNINFLKDNKVVKFKRYHAFYLNWYNNYQERKSSIDIFNEYSSSESVAAPPVSKSLIKKTSESVAAPPVSKSLIKKTSESVAAPPVSKSPIRKTSESVAAPKVSKSLIKKTSESVAAPPVSKSPIRKTSESVAAPKVSKSLIRKTSESVAAPKVSKSLIRKTSESVAAPPHVSISRKTFEASTRPKLTRKAATPKITSWSCTYCTFENEANATICKMCRKTFESSTLPKASTPKFTSWSCTYCTFENEANATICKMCRKKKDGSKRSKKRRSKKSKSLKIKKKSKSLKIKKKSKSLKIKKKIKSKRRSKKKKNSRK